VAERKPFLLRTDPLVLEALQRWANDDLRSLNGQIEFLLRQALRASGRLRGQRDNKSGRGSAREDEEGGRTLTGDGVP
jgi:hypothetical protein